LRFGGSKPYELLTRSGAALKPKDSRIALALLCTPIVNWYFSFKLWRDLSAQALGGSDDASDPPSQTLLWLWWISFHFSLALTALALWTKPSPLKGGEMLSYAFIFEIFARGIWVLAALLCLGLMLRISWRIWRRTQ
jgi:hypothetical protein